MKYFIFFASHSNKKTQTYIKLKEVTSYNCCPVSDRSKCLSGYREPYGHTSFITCSQAELSGQIYLMKCMFCMLAMPLWFKELNVLLTY